MNLLRTHLVFFVLLCFNLTASAQQKYPSTLLWKISGKNLTEPSYLYGTMHLQDKRLFYFGDSLYTAIEKSQGFAIEINPDEMMDSLYKTISKNDTSTLLKKIMSDAEFKKIEKKLEKKFKISADKITTKKIAQEKSKRRNMFQKKDDMPTIMDLYLFSIAKKQGKYTGGIEDLADQFGISDEIGKFDVNELIKDDTVQYKSYMETMLQVYINKDLTTLNNMVNNSNPDFRDILLIKRNRKMAMRMDSLAHVRTTFFAVGAAHLPGDSGVISFLRESGYTVEPVFASKNISPEDYKYTAKEVTWLKVEDENKMCNVEMPGIPSDVQVKQILPMKMYVDLSDMNVYGIAVTALSEEEAKSDSVLEKLVARYKEGALNIKSVKPVLYKNCKGIEMYATLEGVAEYRYRLLIKNNKLFMIIFGAKSKEDLYGSNGEKFMNSLTFNEAEIEGNNKWQLFTNAKNAFSMMTPGKTAESKQRNEAGEIYDQYSSMDYNDGCYYMVVVRDAKAGYFIESDSIYFDEYKKNMKAFGGYNIKEFSPVKFKDYNATHFSALQTVSNSEILIEGYLIRRGNRTYIPMAIMPKEKADFPQVTNFFRSFNPLPFKATEWKKQQLENTGISITAPGVFVKEAADTTSYNYNPHTITYRSQDINSAESYSLEIEKISPYYWSNGDSLFFRNRANSFKGYKDSMLIWKYQNNGIKEAEVLIQKPGSGIFKRFNFYLNGDTVYTLINYQNERNDSLTDKFFSGVKFSQQYPTTIFKNKAAALFRVLQSKDSSTTVAARKVFEVVDFTSNDLPLLYNALLEKYNNYENDYRTVNDMIAGEIKKIGDSTVIDFVNKHYLVKDNYTEESQVLMLELLSEYKTAASYKLLKQLLLNNPPRKGSIYSVINAAADTLELIKDIFPGASVLYADTIAGPGIVKLANNLSDSNLVAAADILQNEAGLIRLADKHYAELRKDNDTYPAYNSEVIDLLGRFNTDKTNALLNKFLQLPVMWVKNNAILALLKNNKAVAATEIKKFAADKEWRTAFYESLKEIKKTSFFPKENYSQLKFADSYLYNSLNEDYEVDIKATQFIKEKTAEIDGKMQRFLIYKVVLNNDENKSAYFAVCGAFEMDKNTAEIKSENLDVYLNYDDVFSLSTVDILFKKYIDQKKSTSKPD